MHRGVCRWLSGGFILSPGIAAHCCNCALVSPTTTQTSSFRECGVDEENLESAHSLFPMHWHHEPIAVPLTRPSDTLSPIGGEGWGEGVVDAAPPRFGDSVAAGCWNAADAVDRLGGKLRHAQRHSR